MLLKEKIFVFNFLGTVHYIDFFFFLDCHFEELKCTVVDINFSYAKANVI